MEHPDVKEAVVSANRDKKNDEKNNIDLVAYVTTRDKVALSASQLVEFAETRLPHYMIPMRFLVLPKLPLTTTGKVDRNALPAPGQARPEIDIALTMPRTAVEKELVKIWGEVLELEVVGVHDNFLHLGGDSIRAMKIVQRVLSTYGIDLPIRELLLGTPTIAQMSEIIETCS